MTEINNKPLPKPVVAICPGHGGKDPGATHGDVTEAQITYAWAMKFSWTLSLFYGIQTHLLFTPKESQERRQKGEKFYLSERIERSQRGKANIFISIHVNSFSDKRAHGSEVWIHAADEKNDLELACVLSEALAYKSIIKDRGIKYTGKAADKDGEHGLYVLRKSLDIPSVLLELGFLSNDGDRGYLLNHKTSSEQMNRVVLAFVLWLDKNKDFDYQVPLFFTDIVREALQPTYEKVAKVLTDNFGDGG